MVGADICTGKQKKYLEQKLEVVIYGHDHLQDRNQWFTDDWTDVDELVIKRRFNISSTKMREAILQDNFEKWCSYTSEEIHDLYETYRSILLAIHGGV